MEEYRGVVQSAADETMEILPGLQELQNDY